MQLYIDVINGDDARDGSSEDDAVQTVPRVLELADEGDVVMTKIDTEEVSEWIVVTPGGISNG